MRWGESIAEVTVHGVSDLLVLAGRGTNHDGRKKKGRDKTCRGTEGDGHVFFLTQGIADCGRAGYAFPKSGVFSCTHIFGKG